MTEDSTTQPDQRILVVDDNPANLKLVCAFLKPFNTVTTAVTSGEEAISLCRESTFDLILMDIHMPGLSGQQTTTVIRQQETPLRTPIVALTAETVEDKKCTFLLADMDDFLSKPIEENDLRDVIERWIESPSEAIISQSKKAVERPKEQALPSSNYTQQEKNDAVFSLNESLKLSKNLPDLATDMFKFLLGSLDETKECMTTALTDQNIEALLEVTHKFHGGCCYCGVPALRKQVKALEQEIHNNPSNLTIIGDLTQSALNEIERLESWAGEHDIDALFGE